ncbi:MAG TPA: hypothetical protein VHZ53_00390 [Steroidobacteraceae bacterium]|jgi:hypothetical protein|nr:hypothetical protein [Steroidobacteraceae bacterium]
MSSDDFNGSDAETTFTFGVRELRQASETRESRPSGAPFEYGLTAAASHAALATVAYRPTAREARGFDPYNSGGFDRKRGWSRIRKR